MDLILDEDFVTRHEAAHAVALMLLRMGFKEIRLQPNSDSLGCVDTGFEFTAEQLEEAIIVYLAPAALEGYSFERALVFGDYKDAVKLFEQLRPGVNPEPVLREMYLKAGKLIRPHIDAVDAIAKELKRTRSLTCHEASRLVDLSDATLGAEEGP
jgi:hypothetical protein